MAVTDSEYQASGAQGKLCLSSRLFTLFLSYALWIWNCELFDLICYLMKLPQVSLVSRILAAALTIILMRKAAGGAVYRRVAADVWFLAGSAILIGFFAVKAVQPDMSYDTQNYHLLCQIPGFADNLHYHVLPGRFQMYGFRLGDRLFYPFRLFLGLRMGTMLNAFAVVLVYRQLTVMLDGFRGAFCHRLEGEKDAEGKYSLRARIELMCQSVLTKPSLLAFFIVCRYELLSQSGTYMVEILALPFLLEMLRLLLSSAIQERAGREALVFCLSGGIFFCMKMTNIVYLLPLLALYVWKNRKIVTVKLFFSCLAVGVLPVSVYLIYNTISTGNPVYPYYNTIFGSPFFQDFNFKDLRWGPNGWMDLILWPYYMIRYPDYRLSELTCRFNLDLAGGYLCLFCLLCLGKRAGRKGHDGGYGGLYLLTAVYVVSLYGWAATTGHSRYFMGGLLLNGLFTAIFCLRAFQGGGKLLCILSAVVLCTFPVRAWYGLTAVYRGEEWAFRVPHPAQVSQNLRWIFRDREIFPEEIKQDADAVLLTQGDFGGYARMIGEAVPVYNRNAVLSELSAFSDYYLSEIEGRMRKGEKIYDMFQQGDAALNSYMENVDEMGYYVEEMIYPDQGLTGFLAYTLTRLSLAGGRENKWFFCQSDDSSRGGVEVLRMKKPADLCRMTAIAGNPNLWYDPAGFEVSVIATDGAASKCAAVFAVDGTGYEKVDALLDLTGLQEDVELVFQTSSVNQNGVVINPEFENWENH